MEIHKLNTKSMTSPAYCALDDGSDTYKLDLNAALNTMNTGIESDISAVDTKVQKKTRIWYASVSSQTGTPSITISNYAPSDNDYLAILFQFGNTSIKDVSINSVTYQIWFKGANTAVKAEGNELVLYRMRMNASPYRLEYVGNHYDLATTSAKGLMSAADKAALDQAVSDVSDIQEELLNKADKVGPAPDLIAGLAECLNTDEGTTIEEPYNLKTSGGNGRELLKKIVGVSVGWNQLVNTGATSVTVTSGHKYYAKVNGVETVAQSSGAAIPINDSSADMVVDITLALGSTIADYVYTLEQATAGSGVAWLKQHFPKMFGSYQPYDAGSIQSVTGLSAHVMRNADDEIIGTYPLDDSLTLRGILKLDASNNLYADGDIYEADGTVTRRYGVVDLGTINWEVNSVGDGHGGTIPVFRSSINPIQAPANAYGISAVYAVGAGSYNAGLAAIRSGDKTAWINSAAWSATSLRIILRNDSYSDAAAFKTAMSGVYLVYELATPTTETADPYTESQIVDSSGTEEFVSTSIVPVGNETFYLADLKGKLEDLPTIPEAPTTDGTYVLKATVSDGVATYSWVSE